MELLDILQRQVGYAGQNRNIPSDLKAKAQRLCWIYNQSAPGVCLACAGHALDPDQRAQGISTSAPITLEDNVWIGANAVICGGVTIGKGSTIGAGSVVTHDIPAGVVAAGVPCRPIRPITKQDRISPEQLAF